MSLISEALKKARQEAAKQDASQRHLPYAVGSAEPASRRSLLGPLVAGLGAGVVVVGAVILAAYFGHWGPWKGRREPAAPEPGGQLAQAAPAGAPGSGAPGTASGAGNPAGSAGALPEEAAPPVPAAAIREDQLSPMPPAASPGASAAPPTAPPVASGVGTSAPASPSSPAPTLPATQPAPHPVAAAPLLGAAPGGAPAPRSAPSPVGAGVPAALPPGAPAVPSSAPAAPPVRLAPGPSPAAAPDGEEKVYTGELPVPGGGVLHLNGIAFSDSPVAVFDGKVMGPGEVVQGFTIVEIQRGRVRLQGHGMSVVLAVR